MEKIYFCHWLFLSARMFASRVVLNIGSHAHSAVSERLGTVLGWLGVFLLFVVARWSVLFDPPTWDLAARGLWIEASFLADSGFDYARLRDVEQNPIRGGAKVYMTSILPTLLAVIMRATKSPADAFLAYHLFTMACAAGVIVFVFALLRQLVGGVAAALAAGAVLTTPLFSAQADLLGMELPLLLCALGCAQAMTTERFLLAATLATLGSLVKFSGAIVTIACIIYLAVMTGMAFARGREERWRFGLGLAVMVAALALQWAVFRLGGYDHELIRPTGL